jgi:hypothetical protein
MAYLATLSGAGGSGGAVVALADQYVSSFDSGASAATYALQSTSAIIATTSLIGPITVGNWVSPTGAAPGAYECRADVNLGSVSGSATGAWLALTSSRSWSVVRSSPGSTDAELTVSIRLGGVTLATCTVYLQAEVA